MSFKTQLITEASLAEIALKVYIPKFTELALPLLTPQALEHPELADIVPAEIAVVISSITAIDPTGPGYVSPVSILDGSSSEAPGKYTKVMLQWVINRLKDAMPGRMASPYQISQKIAALFVASGSYNDLRDPLTSYDSLVKYIEGPEKSFSYFKSSGDFLDFMNSQAVSGLVSKANATRAAKESEVVYEDSTWKVIYPKSHFASAYYGKDTDWCTTRAADSNYYNQYSKAGFLFMAMNKDDPEASIQLYSRKERSSGPAEMCAHSDDAYANIEIALRDSPELMAFFNKVAGPAVTASVEIWEGEVRDGARNVRRYGSELEEGYALPPEEDEEENNEVTYSVDSSYYARNSNYAFRDDGFTVPSVEVTVYANLYRREGDDDEPENTHSYEANFFVAKMTPALLDQSCLEFPDVNFSSQGLFLSYDGMSPDDLETNVETYFNDHDAYYEGYSDIDNSFSGAMNEALALLGITGRLGYIVVVLDNELAPPDADVEGFCDAISPSRFNGDSEPVVTGEDLMIGGGDLNVSISVDSDFGDLSDALADSAFKKLAEGGFYSNEDAMREGQKEFEFSGLSTPSQSVDGIVAPVGVVDMASFDKAVRKPVRTKLKGKKKSS